MTGEPMPGRGGAFTYVGPITWEYSPDRDGSPDPGEVVWAWVAFEEDSSIGKDRPIAVIGRVPDGRLAALMLSSRDHRGDGGWLALGAGSWDPERRPSWVRTSRLLAVHENAVRREGAVLDRRSFAVIIEAMRPAAAPMGRWRKAGARLRRLLVRG